MPNDTPEIIAAVIYFLYGDPTYPQSVHIFRGCKNPADDSAHAPWKSQISKVCEVVEVVEWGFANILSQQSFLDFRAAMKIFRSPVAKDYIVAALLVNIQTCFMDTKPWNT